jgi:cell division protein FtsW (lipid II flippase)
MNTDSKDNHAKQRRQILKSIGSILLLAVWVVFQYRQGNELYAISLILLFAFISISRSKNFIIIAVAVLVLVLFKTPILETWIEIRDTNQATFRALKPSISRLFTPNSGKDTLPTDIQQMVSLLQENKVTEYRVPSSFSFETNMRITEAAWPIRKNDTSPYLIYRNEENLDLTGCTTIDKRKDVSLVYCR